MQRMPGSTGGIVVPTFKHGLTNTIPGLLAAWKRWGFIEGIHSVVGKKPPKSFRQSIIDPKDYEHGYTDNNNIKILCSRLVVADALRRAIPSLDIVLTPNGFAVVNTSNLATASKPRVDKLVGSMLAHRDDCIAALLLELPDASKWLTSSQAQFFGATLFPDLAIVDSVGVATGSRWEKYLELRSQVIDLEASLAEEWLSLELLSALRAENLRSDLTEKEKL